MLKKRFFNKPENNAPEIEDVDTDAGNEEMEEELEIDDSPEPEEEEEDDDETFDEEGFDEELVSLQKELLESQDKYLRLAAEFDNYRKRTLREKTEMIQTAGEALLRDILPVMDDFERGLEQASQAEDMDAVKSGMELIYSKMKDFLSSRGVKEINAMNEPFSTDWHEAVTNIPAPSEDMKGKIVDVIQKGYTLYDKVMRYPKVVVGE